MALIEGNTLSFMFEGVRRGDEDKLKALLNENGEVTLKLLRNESPNLFRSVFHFELVPKFVPQEATPEEPPANWAVHDIPELIVEKEVPDALKVVVAEKIEDLIPADATLSSFTSSEIVLNSFNQRIEDPVDEADDLLVVEGDQLTGETEAVKFPDKEEEIVVEKPDAPVTVKAAKGKKSGK